MLSNVQVRDPSEVNRKPGAVVAVLLLCKAVQFFSSSIAGRERYLCHAENNELCMTNTGASEVLAPAHFRHRRRHRSYYIRFLADKERCNKVRSLALGSINRPHWNGHLHHKIHSFLFV